MEHPRALCQEASYKEAFGTELEILSGACVAGSLVDLEKFYDNFDLGDVMGAAEQLGYPLELSVLAMGCRLGARTITAQGQTKAVCTAATGLCPSFMPHQRVSRMDLATFHPVSHCLRFCDCEKSALGFTLPRPSPSGFT